MLLCITASHQTASFELLDTLSTLGPAVAAALVDQNDFVQGAVVVATCNRFEAYLDVEEPLTAASAIATRTAIDEVSLLSGAPADQVRDSVQVYSGTAVAEHLFQVSSGLKSVVIGEDEIAGQVRRALDTARRERTVSSALERLFQRAAQASRGVKKETGLGAQGKSMVRLALDMAESRVTDWARSRVLLIGTGKYARVTLGALRDRGVLDVRVFSPSGRAVPFAVNQGLPVVESDGLVRALAECDVVVTCTASAEPVVSAEMVRQASTLPGARERRLIIDLGLPRNVEPEVAGVHGTELVDLELMARHAPLAEFSATAEARALVDEAVAEYAAADAAEQVAPAVVALRQHLFDILDAEIGRASGKENAAQIETSLRHLVGVVLHRPSVRARELAAAGDAQAVIDAVNTLFGLEVPAAEQVPAAERTLRVVQTRTS